jgi:dynein heavy chain
LAIANGKIVILQNIEEEIDSQVEHVLNRKTEKTGGKVKLYLGEKEILFNENFRFYLTTKLPNPRYKA